MCTFSTFSLLNFFAQIWHGNAASIAPCGGPRSLSSRPLSSRPRSSRPRSSRLPSPGGLLPRRRGERDLPRGGDRPPRSFCRSRGTKRLSGDGERPRPARHTWLPLSSPSRRALSCPPPRSCGSSPSSWYMADRTDDDRDATLTTKRLVHSRVGILRGATRCATLRASSPYDAAPHATMSAALRIGPPYLT